PISMYAPPERSHTLAPLGVALQVHEWGDPDAAPVVLVHGFLDHARGFDPIVARLARDYRVIAYDARGHGNSGWTDGYAWPLDVAELHAIMRWAGPPCLVIGHSRGGALATDAATNRPELFRRLVNIDGFGPPPEGFAPPGFPVDDRTPAERMGGWLDQRRKSHQNLGWRAYPTLDDVVVRRQKQNPRLGVEWLKHFVALGVRETAEGFVWQADPLVTRGFGPFRSNWIARQWKHLKVPMLAVIGEEQDTWGPLPESVIGPRLDAIPDVTRASIPKSGHFVHMEEPDAFLDLVESWVER
ncbi:MAG: alpha/beta hydrolase, partial [Candidatus Binatia bacterium]|nr:alpha/beta hydrolase [Candidatus Binatia bacterium]